MTKSYRRNWICVGEKIVSCMSYLQMIYCFTVNEVPVIEVTNV